MAKSKKKKMSTHEQIARAAERYFEMPLQDIDAPGGEGRSSMRLIFEDRSVIGTLRPNFRRTHLEAYVLSELSEHCDDVPECLGVVGEIMFQSDVGDRRLNVEIAKVGKKGKVDMAAEAVASIFRIHAAARKTDLHEIMPHLGTNSEWVENFVHAVDFLDDLGGGVSNKFDRDAACEAIAVPAGQFVKWDCRSGNAAIDAAGKLRWFDFEYAGLRHGAEDLAWLLGDEAWPVGPEKMAEIVLDAFDPTCGIPMPEYMEYLSIYLTFHAVQRLKLISKEAANRGWKSKTRIRRYDDAGIHPDFAAHISYVGAYFADQSPLTQMLVPNFLAAHQGFNRVKAA